MLLLNFLSFDRIMVNLSQQPRYLLLFLFRIVELILFLVLLQSCYNLFPSLLKGRDIHFRNVNGSVFDCAKCLEICTDYCHLWDRIYQHLGTIHCCIQAALILRQHTLLYAL